MQKIREQVVARRDLVYQHNEGEVRKRWHYEDAVSDHAVRRPPELWNALCRVSRTDQRVLVCPGLCAVCRLAGCVFLPQCSMQTQTKSATLQRGSDAAVVKVSMV